MTKYIKAFIPEKKEKELYINLLEAKSFKRYPKYIEKSLKEAKA